MSYGRVYAVFNSVNDKLYVGLTTRDIRVRLWYHKRDARKGVDNLLYKAMRKYGDDKFDVVHLIEAESPEDLSAFEIYYIDNLNTKTPGGYNLLSGGSSFFKHSEESKQAISRGSTKLFYEYQGKSYSMRELHETFCKSGKPSFRLLRDRLLRRKIPVEVAISPDRPYKGYTWGKRVTRST